MASAALLLAGGAEGSTGLWLGCTVNSVSVCSASGCAVRKPAISIYMVNYVDRGSEHAAYYRCALRLVQCDRYSALVHRNGDYVVFSLPAQSVFAKLGPDRRVIDVAAIGSAVFVSHGECRQAAPPRQSQVRSR